MPVRPTAVLKDDGQLTKGPEEVLDCWYQHFKKILIVQSMKWLLLCLLLSQCYILIIPLRWRSWRLHEGVRKAGGLSARDPSKDDFVWWSCFA